MSTCDPEPDSVEGPAAAHTQGLTSGSSAPPVWSSPAPSARPLGRADRLTAALRLVVGGALAMAVTYGVGQLFTLATA